MHWHGIGEAYVDLSAIEFVSGNTSLQVYLFSRPVYIRKRIPSQYSLCWLAILFRSDVCIMRTVSRR